LSQRDDVRVDRLGRACYNNTPGILPTVVDAGCAESNCLNGDEGCADAVVERARGGVELAVLNGDALAVCLHSRPYIGHDLVLSAGFAASGALITRQECSENAVAPVVNQLWMGS
jgi:hypothetical protein